MLFHASSFSSLPTSSLPLPSWPPLPLPSLPLLPPPPEPHATRRACLTARSTARSTASGPPGRSAATAATVAGSRPRPNSTSSLSWDKSRSRPRSVARASKPAARSAPALASPKPPTRTATSAQHVNWPCAVRCDTSLAATVAPNRHTLQRSASLVSFTLRSVAAASAAAEVAAAAGTASSWAAASAGAASTPLPPLFVPGVQLSAPGQLALRPLSSPPPLPEPAPNALLPPALPEPAPNALLPPMLPEPPPNALLPPPLPEPAANALLPPALPEPVANVLLPASGIGSSTKCAFFNFCILPSPWRMHQAQQHREGDQARQP
eukprot:366451-Chlamydomonas_euryale.AAC.4